jgi:hypothetical protein
VALRHRISPVLPFSENFYLWSFLSVTILPIFHRVELAAQSIAPGVPMVTGKKTTNRFLSLVVPLFRGGMMSK